MYLKVFNKKYFLPVGGSAVKVERRALLDNAEAELELGLKWKEIVSNLTFTNVC